MLVVFSHQHLRLASGLFTAGFPTNILLLPVRATCPPHHLSRIQTPHTTQHTLHTTQHTLHTTNYTAHTTQHTLHTTHNPTHNTTHHTAHTTQHITAVRIKQCPAALLSDLDVFLSCLLSNSQPVPSLQVTDCHCMRLFIVSLCCKLCCEFVL
jgi:hypothetical protein